jgi:hypothetical protein
MKSFALFALTIPAYQAMVLPYTTGQVSQEHLEYATKDTKLKKRSWSGRGFGGSGRFSGREFGGGWGW